MVRYRVPTALERAGDFSQTTDNNGNLFNTIKDPLSTAACSPTNSAGCFQSGGVVGRIPADRLYGLGLNILKMYPMPNATSAPGSPYNYEKVRPTEQLIANQPAVRVDYQPWTSLRGTFKYLGMGPEEHHHLRHDSRFQRHAAVQAGGRIDGRDGELQPQFHDVRRRNLGPRAERAHRVRPRAGGHRAVALPRARSR